MLQEVGECIVRAAAWLEDQQQSGGGWNYPNTETRCPEVSAQATRALLRTLPPSEPGLKDAISFLAQNANPGGGWGKYPDPSETKLFPTAMACLAIMEAPEKDTIAIDAADDGRNWILEKQNREEGCFPDEEQGDRYVKATIQALNVLGAYGSIPTPNFRKALKWLAEVQNLSEGGWGTMPETRSRINCTAWILEMISMYGWKNEFEGVGGNWSAALSNIHKEGADGYWRDIAQGYDLEATCSALSVLLMDGTHTTQLTVRRPVEWIIVNQKDDGYFSENATKSDPDIGDTSDVIVVLSLWMRKYLDENPFVLIQSLERLGEIQHEIETESDVDLKVRAQEKFRKFGVKLGFFRAEWGQTTRLS